MVSINCIWISGYVLCLYLAQELLTGAENAEQELLTGFENAEKSVSSLGFM